MIKLKTDNEKYPPFVEKGMIETDFCTTESFYLNQPVRIERLGMTEDAEGIYKLYLRHDNF